MTNQSNPKPTSAKPTASNLSKYISELEDTENFKTAIEKGWSWAYWTMELAEAIEKDNQALQEQLDAVKLQLDELRENIRLVDSRGVLGPNKELGNFYPKVDIKVKKPIGYQPELYFFFEKSSKECAGNYHYKKRKNSRYCNCGDNEFSNPKKPRGVTKDE